jgi:hypothetical protein
MAGADKEAAPTGCPKRAAPANVCLGPPKSAAPAAAAASTLAVSEAPITDGSNSASAKAAAASAASAASKNNTITTFLKNTSAAATATPAASKLVASTGSNLSATDLSATASRHSAGNLHKPEAEATVPAAFSLFGIKKDDSFHEFFSDWPDESKMKELQGKGMKGDKDKSSDEESAYEGEDDLEESSAKKKRKQPHKPSKKNPRKKKERPATPAVTVLASNVVKKPDSLAITSAASSVVDLTEDKPQYLQAGENAHGLYSIFYIPHTMSMSTSLTNMLS